jgi:Recombination endonuclease VII
MKKCSRCLVEKDLSDFSIARKAKDGRSTQCRLCCSELAKGYYLKRIDRVRVTSKAWYEANKKHRLKVTRERELSVKYGMDSEKLFRMKEQCGDMCEICGKHSQETGKGLHIDHNHTTGITRGLLCFSCNSAIGKLNVDYTIELLQNAIEYIKRTESYV